jgi:hypothetical protein
VIEERTFGQCPPAAAPTLWPTVSVLLRVEIPGYRAGRYFGISPPLVPDDISIRRFGKTFGAGSCLLSATSAQSRHPWNRTSLFKQSAAITSLINLIMAPQMAVSRISGRENDLTIFPDEYAGIGDEPRTCSRATRVGSASLFAHVVRIR